MSIGAVDCVLLSLLTVSALTDLRTGRIYNRVTYPAMLAGIAASFAGLGPSPAMAILGGVIGGALLYVMFAFGWMGGGDVKLMAAVGFLTGFPFILDAMFYAIFVGGLFAALVLIWRGEVSGLAGDLAMLMRRTAGNAPAGVVTIQPRGGSFPFGVAIGVGTLIALFLQRTA